MSLLDKLHELRYADPDTDLLEFFGVSGSKLSWNHETLTVGDESLPIAEVRQLLETNEASRSIRIDDLN